MKSTKLRLDPEQEQAYKADLNTVVSAGAGSGKTGVLSERYIRLVTERNLDVDQILTLTFTRKAAAEMYARIYRRLSESAHPRAREQLGHFESARISTLDAFCAGIVRSACHRYGIAPDFSMDESRLTRMSEACAIDLLMEYRQLPLIHSLVASRSFDRIQKDLFGNLGRNGVSLVPARSFTDYSLMQLEFLNKEIRLLAAELSELGDSILGIDGYESTSKTLPQAQKAIQDSLPLQIPDDSALEDKTLESIATTAQFLASQNSYKTPSCNVKDPALLELREFSVELKDRAAKLLVLAGTLKNAEYISQLGSLLDDFASRIRERKRAESLLSFQDTAELAVDILRNNPELRLHYKQRIRAIMIDEFQDNNELQKQLLYLLAEKDERQECTIPGPEELAPDKLFFVGDEKQSIYRFRGADVSVFKTLAAELDNGSSALQMNTNYRSTRNLITFFNTVFPFVFGKAESAYEAEYTPVKAPADSEDSGDIAVEFYLNEKDDDAEDDYISDAESEAYTAAQRIIEGLEHKEFNFSDIAVLFRSTSKQSSYERVFRKIGIPFSAADPRGIFAEAPANDFYAFLRLLMVPSDRNAYGTVLRSPFVRISDDAFVAIMLDKESDVFPKDIPEHWNLRNADEQRFKQGSALYYRMKEQCGILDIAELISGLWYQGAYRSVLLEETESSKCLEHFEYLYSLAMDADQRRLSLTGFLDELEPLIGSFEKIENNTQHSVQNTVSFMTIHKSKGLQFPLVIIPDAGSEGKRNNNSMPYYPDKEFGPVMNFKNEQEARNTANQNYFYEARKELEEKQEEAELKRLLYVAVTRAERKLFVFGTKKLNKKACEALEGSAGNERLQSLLFKSHETGKSEIRQKTFLDLFANADQAGMEASGTYQVYAIPALKTEDTGKHRNMLASRLSRLSQKDQNTPESIRERLFSLPKKPPVQIPKRHISPTALLNSENKNQNRHDESKELPALAIDTILTGTGLESAYGTLCHVAIEAAMNKQELLVPSKVQETFRKAKLSTEDRAKLVDAAKRTGLDFISSPAGLEVMQAERFRTEFPFLLPLAVQGQKALLMQGSIDLIYEYNGICKIIDFKTDRYMNPQEHFHQLSCYRLAASAFSSYPVETWLCYIRSMELVPVVDGMNSGSLAAMALDSINKE